MAEQLRQHYLQALGIETYVPRWVLPGAAASPVCEIETAAADDESTAVNSPEPVNAELVADAAMAGSAAGVTAGSTASADIVSKDVKRPLSDSVLGETKKNRERPRLGATAPARTAPEHRFVLSAWRIADDVMVLDSRQSKLALPVDQLLLNMTRALGFGSLLPQPELLRWPLLDSSAWSSEGIAESVENARAMVHAYLTAQQEKQAIRTLLLMGGDALRHGLLARDFDSAGEAVNADGRVTKNAARLLGKSFSLPLGEQLSAGAKSAGESSVGEGSAGESSVGESSGEEATSERLAGVGAAGAGTGEQPPESTVDGARGTGQPATLQVIALPSLAAMLQKPPLKALTWKAIKHLRVDH